MRTALSRTLAVAALVVTAAIPVAGTTATPTTVAVTAPAAAPRPQEGPPCEPGKLCVFDEANFTGHRVDYYECGPLRDVRQEGLTRIASFINNQSGDQISTFYGQDAPHHWVAQFTNLAAGADQDTTDRTTLGVQVC